MSKPHGVYYRRKGFGPDEPWRCNWCRKPLPLKERKRNFHYCSQSHLVSSVLNKTAWDRFRKAVDGKVITIEKFAGMLNVSPEEAEVRALALLRGNDRASVYVLHRERPRIVALGMRPAPPQEEAP